VITVSGVSKSFGAHVLFRDATFALHAGRRTALIGQNGAGKTTLVEILLGEQEPDLGEVHRPKDMQIGFLPQELTDIAVGSVLDTVLGGAEEVRDLEHKLHDLAQRLADTTGPEHDKAMAAYGEAQARFETLGGYAIEAEAQAILAGLGFQPSDTERPLKEMSGGWRMRAALARLLLSKPDVLILDEPTNHLDTDSVAWLEDTLNEYPGAVLFVSHDRDFIDAVADRVVELAFGTATEYVGGFAEFVVEREERIARLEALQAAQSREVARIEKFVDRFRYKATKARQVQSRIKTLEKLEKIAIPTEKELVAKFAFPEPRRSARDVIEIENASVGYDGVPVVANASMFIERGQKLGMVGPNGAGKTTLLKLILGTLPAMTGSAKLGSNVDVATFAQHQVDQLDFNKTVLQELHTALQQGERRNPRTILGSFGFPGDVVDRKVAVLSGGERTRLALCKVMLNPVNLLILDEPTNHLDLASCDLLEDALRAYPGTVLLVSHDRYLIREVCDGLIAVRNGKAVLHQGVDEGILSPHSKAGAAANRSSASVAPVVKQSAKQQSKQSSSKPSKGNTAPTAPVSRPEEKRNEAEQRNAKGNATRDLKKKVEKLERELGKAEAEVIELHHHLANPDVYGDPEKVRDIVAKHEAAKNAAAKLTDDWLAASDELERAEKKFR
jgi:ATP-binding cassette, subfamily F, member 3